MGLRLADIDAYRAEIDRALDAPVTPDFRTVPVEAAGGVAPVDLVHLTFMFEW